MAYTNNPYVPKVRAKTVRLVQELNWPINQAARYMGIHRATLYRWLEKTPLGGASEIPTHSSRPHNSPRALDQNIVERIVALRRARGRCAEAIWAQLQRENVRVSLSTVHRTLQRHHLIKERSPWKKYYVPIPRPIPEKPGILTQMDSIHLMKTTTERSYIITFIDLYSRWAHAWAVARLSTYSALQVVRQTTTVLPFTISCIQTDHGPEFSSYFTMRLQAWQITHRHSRVRRPNDNAHIERFNRTLQDELTPDIKRYKGCPQKLNLALQEYLHYYNTERLHMGLNYQTPQEVSQRC